MAKSCGICGKKISMMNGIKLSDGSICTECFGKAGQKIADSNAVKTMLSFSTYSTNDIKSINNEIIEFGEIFSPTKKIGKYIEIDDVNNLIQTGSKILTIDTRRIFRYEQILNVTLLENGGEIGEIGSTVAGGILFGGTGAVVGSILGSKHQIDSLKIKITLKNSALPVVYIEFMKTPDKKTGSFYKDAFKKAQAVLSELQLVLAKVEAVAEAVPTTELENISAADEILKFKELFDAGILTQEEFDAKKKQLLGL